MKILNGRKVFELELDEQDLLVLHTALIRQPYADVALVIDKINRQLAPQTQPQSPSPPQELPPLPEGADYIRHQNGMPR
jgi:hypothetical protein